MHKVIDVSKYIGYLICKLFEYIPFKTFFTGVFVTYNFLLGGTLDPFVVRCIFFLVVFDFITGIYAAKKNGEEIKSAKVIRSAIKLVVYMIMISAAHITELAVPIVASFCDETVVGFLAITELISILENTGKMGFMVPKKMLNTLKEVRDLTSAGE